MVQPPSASPPNPQQIQQFLSSVLSQRGPSALPYAENNKWLIRQHLLNLVSACPSLEPRTATFTHTDGRSVNLLQADGTVPMPFQGVTYNIPVVIWLLESYPRHPPFVYVNPTRDMIIKRPHSHVTPSGLVSTPYIQNWVYPSSNLVDLAGELGAVFSRDPPLYSHRRPTPPPSPSPRYSPPLVESDYESAVHTQTRVDPPQPRQYPPSPYGGSGRLQQHLHQHHQQQTDDAAEAFKRNSVNKLLEMVHADLSVMRRSGEAEAEGFLSAQAELKRREEEINKRLKEMLDEKETLEQQLQVMFMNTDVLDSWIKQNEGKTNQSHGLDVDNALDCVDASSKQMLECSASDLAIEDAVYSLDKAMQEGAVPFDQYLRNVRLLSREQFFHKATAAKVRAARMDFHFASIAAAGLPS